MPRLYIPVGIPGCGKTTFLTKVLPGSFSVVSTDAIRAELVAQGLLESVNDMSQNDRVFDTYHERLERYLIGNEYMSGDVAADATNLRDFARKTLRDIAERAGAETHLFVFTNPAVAVHRNMKRDRVVPAEAMVSMLSQYEQMLKDIVTETYTSVTFIENTRG